jgi:hypothetical protein
MQIRYIYFFVIITFYSCTAAFDKSKIVGLWKIENASGINWEGYQVYDIGFSEDGSCYLPVRDEYIEPTFYSMYIEKDTLRIKIFSNSQLGGVYKLRYINDGHIKLYAEDKFLECYKYSAPPLPHE